MSDDPLLKSAQAVLDSPHTRNTAVSVVIGVCGFCLAWLALIFLPLAFATAEEQVGALILGCLMGWLPGILVGILIAGLWWVAHCPPAKPETKPETETEPSTRLD